MKKSVVLVKMSMLNHRPRLLKSSMFSSQVYMVPMATDEDNFHIEQQITVFGPLYDDGSTWTNEADAVYLPPLQIHDISNWYVEFL